MKNAALAICLIVAVLLISARWSALILRQASVGGYGLNE
jgi:hypothetical protein